MKIKILLFLLLLSAYNITKANGFSFPIAQHANIVTIDAALNEAKTLAEIKAVSVKMYQFIFTPFNDTCPPPKTLDYKALCADIGSKTKVPEKEQTFYEYTYEKRILQLACVNIGVDDEETTKSKVQLFWNKYKTNCKCDSVTFGVQNGNILKFALSQSHPQFIETLSAYGIDINFTDPADGLNLLDYVISEIERMKKLQNSENAVMVYERYKAGIIAIGGKSNKK